MKADTASSGYTRNPSTGNARDRRVKLAGEIIDRIDIARHLVLAETVSSRMALALRILEQTADEIAILAGIADDDRERREAEAIRRAAEPPPRRTRRSFLAGLDAVAFTIGVGLAVLGAFLFVMMAFFARWW
jgi:hypothetical protein